MRCKGFAIDLDGTLLTPDELVSPRNAAAVQAAIDAGLHIVVATARWYQMAEVVARQFGLDGPVVACAGAEVRRLSDGTDLMDVRLPTEFAAELYEICDAERCIATVALDTDVVVKMDGEPSPGDMPAGMSWVPSLAATLDQAPRIALIQGRTASQRVVEELADRWKDRVQFIGSISSNQKAALNLTAAGADKGVALEVACRDLGVSPAEMVAIGDSDNDIGMFRVAGASFAMGQGSDEVKAAATAVTLSNAEDGVAAAIELVLEQGDAIFV
ncbi:MAG: Cof-type HAD-IIB family hydrolase [Acidimicrobiales bacterium]